MPPPQAVNDRPYIVCQSVVDDLRDVEDAVPYIIYRDAVDDLRDDEGIVPYGEAAEQMPVYDHRRRGGFHIRPPFIVMGCG